MDNNFLNQPIATNNNVEGLIKDILDDAATTRVDINNTLTEIMTMMSHQSNNEDLDISALIGFIGPIAKDLYDLLLKNNRNKIEIAKVIQKFYETDKKINAMGAGDEDMKLFEEFEKELVLIQKESKETKDELGGLENKISSFGK